MKNNIIVKQKAIIKPIELKIKIDIKEIKNQKIFKLLDLDSASNEEKKLKEKKSSDNSNGNSKKFKKKILI